MQIQNQKQQKENKCMPVNNFELLNKEKQFKGLTHSTWMECILK